VGESNGSILHTCKHLGAATSCVQVHAGHSGFGPQGHGEIVSARLRSANLESVVCRVATTLSLSTACALRRDRHRLCRRTARTAADEEVEAELSATTQPAIPPAPPSVSAESALSAGPALQSKPSPLLESQQRQQAAQEASRSAVAQVSTALVVKQLTSAELALGRWSYLVEVVYTWLGMISLALSGFSLFSRGGAAFLARSPSMKLGLVSVGFSVIIFGFVGWFQARSCRNLARRCGIAASSLEPGGPVPPPQMMLSRVPPLEDMERLLRARQCTAWIGAAFALLGMQTMLGLLVLKVLSNSGSIPSPSSVSLDIFTLLAVVNAALSHVIGGGIAAIQQKALPSSISAKNDALRGWGRQ